MKFGKRSVLLVTLGLVLGSALSLGTTVFAERSGDAGADTTLPLDELRTFTEVFGKVKADYVEPVKDKTLLENAIRGMISGLDPHSAYMDKAEFKELQEGTTGEFGGLGIEVGMEDGFIKVISPIDDTPAQKAGVKAGDLIIRLDDTPVKGMSLNDAVKKMRGKPGSKIVLTIIREGEQKPLKITITRAVIKVKSVKFRTLEPGYGYIRITSFQTHTAEDMDKALTKLLKANGGKLKGLVLDLRNNPGGVLNAAVGVVDAFISKGLIVYTEGRAADSQLKFTATPHTLLKRAPMVVLVNGGSASASEIVSGALQDHKRAIIMGTRTFGKGSVQTIFPMSNGAGIKLTTARYYTPSGRSIQAEGIKPDIEVHPAKVSAAPDNSDIMIKEADLSRHLKNGNGKKEVTSSDKADDKATPEEKDYQLNEALNLLKGLNIMDQARAK